MRFKDIAVVNVKMAVFLGVALCRLVNWYLHFRGVSFK
jgi:hypothetical protein